MDTRNQVPDQNDFAALRHLEAEVIKLRKILDKERAAHIREIAALKAEHKEKLKARTAKFAGKARKFVKTVDKTGKRQLTHDRRKVTNITKLVRDNGGDKVILTYLVHQYVGLTTKYTAQLLNYKEHTIVLDAEDKVNHYKKHPKQYQNEIDIIKKCENTIRSVRSRLVTMAM